MRRAHLSLFEKDELIEQLARDFYKLKGCIFHGKRMQNSTHPEEVFCVLAAKLAIEKMSTN